MEEKLISTVFILVVLAFFWIKSIVQGDDSILQTQAKEILHKYVFYDVTRLLDKGYSKQEFIDNLVFHDKHKEQRTHKAHFNEDGRHLSYFINEFNKKYPSLVVVEKNNTFMSAEGAVLFDTNLRLYNELQQKIEEEERLIEEERRTELLAAIEKEKEIQRKIMVQVRKSNERKEAKRLKRLRIENAAYAENVLWNLNQSPLTNYFNAVEGGETTLYYLKLKNKFGETRYKIGVTLNSVYKRYSSKFHSQFEILYEKKLTHANGIEKAIIKKFQHLVTDEGLIGTTGTEIFREDVLRLSS